MEDFTKASSKLAQLETFDPNAFVADDPALQRTCSFVLALALIYNDLKDVIYAKVLLHDYKPQDEHRRRKELGAYAGMDIHIIRYIFGLLRELCKFIKDNEEVLEDPFFKSVVRQLDKRSCRAWQAIVNVSLGKQDSSRIGTFLLMIRHKVSFHYDIKEICRGYREHFFQNDKIKDLACISRGDSMETSRFYFADAAVLGYLTLKLKGNDRERAEQIGSLVKNMNLALLQLVDRFIQRRNFPYKRFE